MTTTRHVALGFFFVAVVGVLAYYTLFKTDFRLFGETHRLTVHFNDTNGLREGDSVLVAGVRWGKIQNLVFDPTVDPERRITVTVALDEAIALYRDHVIMIEDSTLLGGKQLTIDVGLPRAGEIDPNDVLYGTVEPDVLEALGELVNENRAALTASIAGIETIVEDVLIGRGVVGSLIYDDELAADLRGAVGGVNSTFVDLSAIAAEVRRGEGTLGQLIYDAALYTELTSITATVQGLADDARRVLDDVRTGDGTISRLIYDGDMAVDVAEALGGIRRIVDEIEAGQGTIGQLVKDDTIALNLEKITTDLAHGRGTFARLLSEDDVYRDLEFFAQNLHVVSVALRDQDGTIGKLVFDDELYRKLDRAISTLTGSLEEAREAAPISTFLNTVFLGF